MLTLEAFNSVKSAVESVKSNKVRQFPEAASIGDTFRQGDVYITLMDKPSGDIVQNPSAQIAIGDTQGSRHCIDNLNNVTVYKKTNPTQLDGPILLVKSPITITHPEHGHVSLPVGCYEITYQRNLDAEEREIRARD